MSVLSWLIYVSKLCSLNMLHMGLNGESKHVVLDVMNSV